MASPPESYAPAPAPAENVGSFPMLVPVLILFIFVVGFFSIYLLHNLVSIFISSRRRRATLAQKPPVRGLDRAILETFPTFEFRAVRGTCDAECAVCLAEFNGGDAVRMLSVCSHVFHRGCIDEWLEKHTTCPVCRSDLEEPPVPAAVSSVEPATGGDHAIIIEDGGEGDQDRGVVGSRSDSGAAISNGDDVDGDGEGSRLRLTATTDSL
ncbi:hypothetical protein J5N97_018767 [Dioscorea zingiberensis]|uniref:RING-type E3 ubiquitin transferase n=1 Tax=Dioscorea zingiberensis TaxID=325984 RepID=A0A9D5CDL8_9LILI|nr:hypothetical protein J5N97_018767 [Dioscorea zingiberensis]